MDVGRARLDATTARVKPTSSRACCPGIRCGPRNALTLRGLNNHGYLNDTWTWDGTNWTQAAPALSPSGRDFSAMTLDANTGAILLFGGFRVDASPFPHPVDFNDTWSWDGYTWRQLAPPASPPALTGAVMAYDETEKAIVLFGRRSNLPAEAPNDLWTWDGATWARRSP